MLDISIDPDETATERVSEISSLPDVQKVVALNDLHHGIQETPVSIATATNNTIYLELTSNVINCGMSLVRTNLTEDQLTDAFISEFCTNLRMASEDHSPTSDQARKFLTHGAESVVEQYSLPGSTLDRIENGGSMFAPEPYPSDVTELVPPWLLQYSGTYQDTPIPSLKSNHFIEFQTVDEIVDEETAREWGLSEDQVVIFIHGDYALTFYLNWHHANRRKFREQISFRDRAKMQASKAMFHLWRDGVSNFSKNWSLYNNTGRYTGVDADSREGRHLSRVIYAAMNFGYANRLLASICLDKAIQASLDDGCEVELLWDVGHDTIQEETVDGEQYWIHRKGAAKAVPGKPALVSGSYNMNSFLGKGQPGASEYLYSYDHGCSNVIDFFESEGRLSNLDLSTDMYEYTDGSLTETIQHVDSGPIEAVVDNLSANEVLSEVAWLRPVANVGE